MRSATTKACATLEKSCVGGTLGKRLLLLTRFTQSIFALAEIMGHFGVVHFVWPMDFPLDMETVDRIKPFIGHLAGMKTVLDQIEDHIPVLNESWSHDVLEFKGLAASLDTVLPAVVQSWRLSLQAVVEKFEELCPPRVMIESQVVLTDAVMQKTLNAFVCKLTEKRLMAFSGTLHSTMKTFLELSGMHASHEIKQVVRELARVRRFAKTCISVEWAVSEIVKFAPGDGKTMVAFGKNIVAKLEQKGLSFKDSSLPSWLEKVLLAMMKTGTDLMLQEEAGKECQAEME